jgi:hypothetical protein
MIYSLYPSYEFIGKIHNNSTKSQYHISRPLWIWLTLLLKAGLCYKYIWRARDVTTFVKSICSKIELLLWHINSDTTLGKLFRTNLNWRQLHLGLSTKYMKANNIARYIFPSWFQPHYRIYKSNQQKNAHISYLVAPSDFCFWKEIGR